MHHANRRNVLLVQLPIPPLGPSPIRGNVPLAAAYLKVYAEGQGLGAFYDIELLPVEQANTLGDQALVAAITRRRPWMVGFTCYLWNIERTLWLAQAIKRALPGVRIVLGGPEITADNAWVLQTTAFDFAVIGEGEQTFTQLLLGLRENKLPPLSIPGLYVAVGPGRHDTDRLPPLRTPLPNLNDLGSPYLAGVLNAADERMMLLETSRGCRYRCRFCYYWKAYDTTYFLADETIRGCLRHAAASEVREVFLLDPTLNQRRDFAGLLRLLAECNPSHRFTYFAELRGEGVTEETAQLLRAANFTEVEVGLQSIEPDAMTLMDRKNNLRAFERGVRAMMGQGIKVKVDLIIGLPGDSVASVRRGLHYVHDNGLGSDLQVFNLAVLPGTAFRQDADQLGLVYQSRPPYYVLKTPHLSRTDLFGLMQEAQDLFGIEFDAQPEPILNHAAGACDTVWQIDLDHDDHPVPSPVERRAQVFTLWLRSERLHQHGDAIAKLIRGLLQDNPFTTLQVVVEPAGKLSSEVVCREIGPSLLGALMAVCQASPTYLDKFYALQPGRINGSKRLIVLLPLSLRKQLPFAWVEAVGEAATLVWRAGPGEMLADGRLEPHEFACLE
jgi:radical SAM superfamily enzyme YgiQ (UPF0313 family)